MKTLTKTSHIGTVRNNNLELKDQVQSCLDWTDQEYCDHQFEQYCEFVESLTTGWHKVREQILYSAVFRGFWNNNWSERDREFLGFAETFLQDNTDPEDIAYVLDEYRFSNSAKRLLEDDEFMSKYYQILKLL